jgi:chromosome segregation ATPase
MNWLRDHMREQLAKAPSAEVAQNIVSFPGDARASSREEGSAALDLVSQAAGVIRGIQDRAAESEARAKALAECALEKLELAETRINDAEAARARAEATLSHLIGRLQEAEQELTRTQSRIAAAENQLVNAERQMRAAEARAIHAEKAVSQIEDAIREQLMGLQRNLTARSTRAA